MTDLTKNLSLKEKYQQIQFEKDESLRVIEDKRINNTKFYDVFINSDTQISSGTTLTLLEKEFVGMAYTGDWSYSLPSGIEVLQYRYLQYAKFSFYNLNEYIITSLKLLPNFYFTQIDSTGYWEYPSMYCHHFWEKADDTTYNLHCKWNFDFARTYNNERVLYLDLKLFILSNYLL